MPTQNVNLTPELDQFVKDEVSNGEFNNASEVHRAALDALAKRKEERELRLERLRQEIQKGIDDVEAGRVVRITSESELDAMMDDCFDKAISRLEAENAEPAE